jgi:uncharacterized protein YbjT (DUF2867 family)
MILVVSPSGMLGGKVATALKEQGFGVRGLCRYPGSHPELAEKGIELVQGDLRQPDSLVKACEGVKTVIATAHAVAGNGKNDSKAVDLYGNRSLIDAAKSKGVEHFIFISIPGDNASSPVDFARHKYATEEYLKASGMKYTIIRPQAYMEIWGLVVGEPIFKKGKTQVFGRGNNPVSFISAEDVKQFIVLAVTEPSLQNKIIELGGPENITVNELVEKFAEASGKPTKVTHVPVPVLRVMRPVMKLFRPGMGNLIGLSLIMDTTPGITDSTELAKRFKVKQTTLDQFIEQKVNSRD